jgi:hypothetical protein
MQDQVSMSQSHGEHVAIGRVGRRAEPGRQQAARTSSTGVPWWTVAAAGAAPPLLVVGFLAAATLQPDTYDPIRDTISSLAARGAADPWAMTAVLAAVGACYLATALGLRSARRSGRLVLAGGGVATLAIAAFPTPLHGYSRLHALAVVAASATMCAWPVLGAHRRHRVRVLRLGPNLAASAVTFGLILWFTLEISGGDLGLAERCAAVAPALWLFAVAFGAHRAPAVGDAVELDAPAHLGEGPGRFVDLEGGYESRRATAT